MNKFETQRKMLYFNIKPKYQKENEPNENNSENENICEKKWVEIEEEINQNIGNEMTKYKVKYEDKTEIVDENEIEIIIPAKIMQIKNFFANPIHEIQTIISTPKTSKTSKNQDGKK
ncbi:hypothetical protein M0811_14706 [Anaeramoeba ignava]|uniref:Uncharacterized protein n=1 Tax=Anaeramoeba ignava TaxID=1746090 RepID=A0A9Q0LTK4_ANAIG|nr:hypothetical protein M0811_14706 [Anaeramoeba ignava]